MVRQTVVFFVVLLLVVVGALVNVELLFKETGAPNLLEICPLLCPHGIDFNLIAKLHVLAFLVKLLRFHEAWGLRLLLSIFYGLVRRIHAAQLVDHLVNIC